jgi:cytoskeletal protein RodZ
VPIFCLYLQQIIMAEKKDSKSVKKPTPEKKSPKSPKNNKTLINLVVVLFLSALLIASLFVAQRFETETEDPNSFADLLTAIRAGEVSKIELQPDRSNFNVELYEDPQNPNREEVKVEEYPNILSGTSSVPESLRASLGEGEYEFGLEMGRLSTMKSLNHGMLVFLKMGLFGTSF